MVVKYLRKIQSFEPVVFLWHHHRHGLWSECLRIQKVAKIHLEYHGGHEHMGYCYVCECHDLWRAFATVNEGVVSAEEL